MEIREEEFTNEFAEECKDTFDEHLREIAVLSLEPEVNFIEYIRSSQRGTLAMMVARDEGKVVGYLGYWIINDVNHKAVLAQQAGFYLNENYRKGFNAVKMIRAAEKMLKEGYDVDLILNVSTVKKDLGPLFKYLKYKEAETMYLKEI